MSAKYCVQKSYRILIPSNTLIFLTVLSKVYSNISNNFLKRALRKVNNSAEHKSSLYQIVIASSSFSTSRRYALFNTLESIE